MDMGQGLGAVTKPSVAEQMDTGQKVPMPSLRNAAEGMTTPVAPLEQSLAQRPPSTVTQTKHEDYTPIEKADIYAKTLLKQGDIKEAIAAHKGILDITEAATTHALNTVHKGLAFIQGQVGQGASPQEAKANVLQYAAQVGLDPEFTKMMSSPMTNVAPNGAIVITQPDGSTITKILQSDGTVKITHEKAVKPTGQKIMSEEFTETNGIGAKKFETTHQWQFHGNGKYSDQQLFDEFKRRGGTDAAAISIAKDFGGVEKVKKENQSYATPASVINFDRRTTLVGTDKEGQPINQSPDGNRTVQMADGTMKPYYGPIYSKSEASAMSTEGGGTTGELTPAQKVANKKAAANPQAIALKAASTMYDQEAPEIKRLRVEAQKEGFIPSTKFKNLEQADQWLNDKTGGPNTILLKKKVKFLADGLQKAIGGNAGGEWAFKVASDILDPSYPPESFNAIVDSHGKSLRTMASERIEPFKATTPSGPPKPREGYKLQSKTVNGKTVYREVPK